MEKKRKRSILSVVGGLVRHAITTAGGYLLANPEMLPPEWAAALVVLGGLWSTKKNADLKLPKPPAVTPLLLVAACCLLPVLWLASGCATVRETIEERPVAAKAVVTLATLKVIKPGDVERAQRVEYFAEFVATRAAEDAATSVVILEELVRSRIDWEKLAARDPADAVLLDLLIVLIRDELVRRFGIGELAEADRLIVRDVMGWVADAARLRIPSGLVRPAVALPALESPAG